MPSASTAPYSLRGKRSRCVTSLACRKSLLRAARLRVQEERCWQAQTADLFGLHRADVRDTGNSGLGGLVCGLLGAHHAVIHALGIRCNPVIVKAKKNRFSTGLAGEWRVARSDF